MDWTLRATHAVPAGQPESVHQVAQRLFPAYTVEGGRVHLAGCTLEERLFARLRYQAGDSDATIYVDADGRTVDDAQAEAVGLLDTTAIDKPAPQCALAASRFFTQVLPRLYESSARGPRGELTAVAVIWCKFAAGKLRFTIGAEAVDLAFADWARTVQAPPFVCVHSGVKTFRLAAADDGRIAAAEQLACCELTGRRTLVGELVTCSVTGRRVVAAEAPPCPVCGEPVCRRARVRCEACQEEVSPTVLVGAECRACRTAHPIERSDPRLLRLRQSWPGLARWRNWRWAETADVYIATSAGWFERLLLVVDKHTLALKRVARGHRLSGAWKAVNSAELADVLGAGAAPEPSARTQS